ncbi:uncharacterized protein [Dysidea avara]|uniref:uncharacterized protein isoform X2 n=1 Tax=Dysidea avara TaxID=196820 RepID=UPI00331A7547
MPMVHVIEIGQDQNDKEYRQGADAIVVDLDWKEQRYIGKKLHSIFFQHDTDFECMESMLRKFSREIMLLSELKHENIISFIGVHYSRFDDVSRPRGAFFLPMLVMERVPFSLTQYIDTFTQISDADVVNVLCDIARGLVYLHEDHQVVHSDLSSNNILLTSKFHAKIADFGSAQRLGEQHCSTQLVKQPAAGTPAFMPPEALMDPPCYTLSVDIFSFGCIIVHMITHKWPDMLEASGLERRQHLIDMMRDSFLLSTVKTCLDVKEKRPACKELLADLSKMQNPEGRINNEDRLQMAFKLMKEAGVNKTLEYLLNVTSESSGLTPIQRDFQNVTAGDHLVYKTACGWNVNFYVVSILGKGKIHVSTFFDDSSNEFVEAEFILDPTKAELLEIKERILSYTQLPEHTNIFKKVYKDIATITVEKKNLEKFKSQGNTYNFLHNNSEHFVTFIKTGIAKCQMCKEIEIVFEKYLFVHAVQSNSLEQFTPIIRGGNWALLLGTIKDRVTVSDVMKPIGIVGKEALVQAATSAARTLVKQVSKETFQQTASASTAQTAKIVAVNAAKQSAKASAVVGVAVEGVIYLAQMGNAVYQCASGKMDKEEFKNYAVEQTAMSGGSTAGGIGGSVAGAATGAAVGSLFPVVGTIAGAFVGGVLGGVAGGLGGTAVGKGTGVAINHLRGTKEWNFGFKNPGGIAISPDNGFLILDTLASQVLVLNCELMLVSVFTVYRDGSISKPSGIAASKSLIAVGDSRNHCVKMYSRRGDYLSTIDNIKGNKEDHFELPLGLYFNSKGILYVADGQRVYAFDTGNNNVLHGVFGSSEGSDLKKSCHPVSIAVDSSDNIYVTNYCSNCVNMYSRADHKFLCKIDCNKPCAIAFSPDNHMIAADDDSLCVFSPPLRNRFFKRLLKSRNENIYSRQVINKFGCKGSKKGEFHDICSIVVSKQGTIYVADRKNDRIQIIGTMVWRK